MRLPVLFCVLACISFAHAANVSIDPDRMLVVDGQRTFVIGLYENPKDDAILDDVARAGFNLTRTGTDTAELDRLQARGLHAWIGTGSAIDVPEESTDAEKRLGDLVQRVAAHPAFWCWEVPDETLWSTWLNVTRTYPDWGDKYRHLVADTTAESDAIARGYAILKRLDSAHPVWMNHAAGNSVELLARYARGADIVACDMYPLMPYPTTPIDISRNMLASVGKCTQRMQASAPGKPVWMVLQGTGWYDPVVFDIREGVPSQEPTPEETRFMAYDTIVHGARGVLYWGTHIPPKDGPLWRTLLGMARELADNAALLSAPDAAITPTIETRYFGLLPWPEARGNIAVRALGKQLDGKTHWIIVNECPFPVGYTLGKLDALDGTAYAGADSPLTVKGGRLSGVLPRYGVQILRPAE